MAIKICFNNQIHRFSKFPSDFKALIGVISTTFADQLPKSWSIYYVDSDGDKITLSHDQTYQELVERESKGASVTVKIYVEANEALVSSYTSISDIKLTTSQYQREKTAHADYNNNNNNQSGVGQQQTNEVEPRACPQPLDEGCVVELDTNIIEKAVHKNKKHLIYKALHLFRKLSDQDLSEEKKTELLTKLKETEESFSTEERVEYGQKKEQWRLKQLDPQAALEEQERKQCRLEVKQLFKQLRNKNLSESERIQVLNQLKELEEKLSPEQREKLDKRREKWQNRTGMRKQKMQKGFSIFKTFRMLNMMTKADTETIGRIRENAFKKITDEEAKKVLEPVFKIMMSETSDKNAFGNLLDQAREQLLNIYHPQDKETVIQQWKQLQEKSEKSKQRREVKKEGVEKKIKKEKGGRCLEKYSPEVAEKALKMRQTLKKGGMERLCKFVAQSLETLSIEEMIIMYRTKHDEKAQRRAIKELQA